jgi:type VI secretion system protein ImpK
MNAVQTGQSFVVNQFRECYREMMRLKAKIVRNEVQEPPGEAGDHERSEAGQAEGPHAIWIKMVETIHELARKAGHQGSPCTAEAYREAQYVMAAMADETFLNLDWPGREWWRRNLVETHFFQSHVAGERLFQRIEQLLANRESACAELAALYLMALSLGFQGKFRGEADREPLERLRRDLFQLIFHRSPNIREGKAFMFPDAYAHTLDGSQLMTLPNPRRWLVGAGVCVAAYVLVAHGLWRQVTADLAALVADILALG